MAACEKCWEEASRRALFRGGSVVRHYHHVLLDFDHGNEHAEEAD